MVAVEVELLAGRYIATSHSDRNKAEWPPHPARFFSALVAEWGGAATPDDRERDVLISVESWGPPEIAASDAVERAPVTHFVPVNDATVIGNKLWRRVASADEARSVIDDPLSSDKERARARRALDKARDVTAFVTADHRTGSNPLPTSRGRQARSYPSVTPADAAVTFVWPHVELADDERRALDGLLERVTRLGHSSSLVNCRLAVEPLRTPNWVPTTSEWATLQLRTIEPGQLDALVTEYRRHRGSAPRSLPATMTHYEDAGAESRRRRHEVRARSNMAGEWFVYELDQQTPTDHRKRRLAPRLAAQLGRTFRAALIAHADDPPAILHGHGPDGARIEHAHASFLALPDVAHRHANGQLIGLALMLPPSEGVSASDRRRLLQAVGTWETEGAVLRLPGGQIVNCARVSGVSDLKALQRRSWALTSTTWVSATPIALPWRARKANDRANEWKVAREWVVRACRHVGLPAPSEVWVDRGVLLSGAEAASRYPAFRQGGSARRLVHARIEFDEPIEGPVVLGSGRYVGLGLMRPIERENDV